MNIVGIIAIAVIVWGVVWLILHEHNKPTKRYIEGDTPWSGYWTEEKKDNEKSGLQIFFSSLGITVVVFALILLIGKCTTDLGIGDNDSYVNDAHTYDRY